MLEHRAARDPRSARSRARRSTDSLDSRVFARQSSPMPGTLREALERYEPVIGLEVHAQLLTKSKLFSTSENRYDPEHPNRHVNEYCFGLPGVLPVLNRAAVAMAIRAGLALGCRINSRSVWSRKQYFYPDLPKGYQISQYDQPLCQHGRLEIAGKTIRIARIHMEEDAGKSTHAAGAPWSLVDFNRAGVPLIEIVTEPDLRSAQEATAYLRELRSILMTLDVCDGNMEEGSFRCDANVSIRPRGTEPLGTRCEIKNVNSFKFIEQAIEHEIVRHAQILSRGGRIEQETRLFDSERKETRSMRGKEEAHDYRYLPDPDLPVLSLEESWIDELRAGLPELPPARRRRYLETLELPHELAETFVERPEIARFFDEAVALRPKLAVEAAHFIAATILREPSTLARVSPETVAELVELKVQGKISSTQQKQLFEKIVRDGAPLAKLLAESGGQISDRGALEQIIDDVLATNPENVAKYRAGKTQVLNAILGQVMKASSGKANPALVRSMLEERLKP
jgi:aspartyl-tRNA(Asn)/glutamyl-tRNA(Gln) amidotransferase subunit B